MDLHVASFVTPPFVVLRCEGELDLHTGSRLVRAVDDAVAQGCRMVVLDLAGVSFIDCAGLGAVMTMLTCIQETAGQLVVSAASPQVTRLLRLTGTDRLLQEEVGTATALVDTGPA